MANITLTQLFMISAAALMFTGIFGIITRNNMMKILLSINIMQTGVNLLLTAVGYVEEGGAAILSAGHTQVLNMVDPLPQALVLTSIVIGFGTTALALALIIRHYAQNKSLSFYKKTPLNLKETDK